MPHVETPRSPLISKLSGLHLFHFEGAPCAQRVRFGLAEKGLRRGLEVPWQSEGPETLHAEEGTWISRHVSLIKKDHLTPEYAAIQPNMVVPALVHDGRLYVESMDILSYLDERFEQGRLVPVEPAAANQVHALVEEAKKLHISVRYVSFRWGLGRLGKLGSKDEQMIQRLEPASSPEKLGHFYGRYDRNGIDDATYAEHLRALEGGYERIGQLLSQPGHPFLTGDEFTAADIIWSLTVFRIYECGYPFDRNFPAVAEWFGRVQERPGFKNGVMQRHRAMSRAFRFKSKLQNWLGMGLQQVSRSAAG